MRLFRSDDGSPRWHLVYFALAAFDLITVLIGLSLSHNLMGMYADSARDRQQWAQRVGAITRLSDLAQAANAPGNDVFDSGDVPAERARRDEALVRFNAHISAIRGELQSNVSAAEQARIRTALDLTQRAMNDMVTEAEFIFRHLETSDRRAAGQRMAAMDRA